MAVRSFKDRAERVKARNERVRLDALQILRHMMHDAASNPAQVAADSKLSKSEAPFYLFAASQIGAASVAKEAASEDGPKTTLNVMIMGQAPSNEAWLQAVKDSQAPKVIEATVVEAKK